MFWATFDIMSLMVQINVALRELIYQKIGNERVNIKKKLFYMTRCGFETLCPWWQQSPEKVFLAQM